MGASGGMLFLVGAVGGFTAPYLAGFLVDLTGSTLPGVIAMAMVGEATLLFTLPMKEK